MNLETELRDDLRDLVADQPFVPNIEVAVQRGRRLRRRGQAIRGAAALSLVAGITATTVALNQPPAPPTAQAIVARTVAAITAEDGAFRITGGGQQETFDITHQSSEVTDLSNGKPTWTKAVRKTGPGTYELRIIDYQKHVWASTTHVAEAITSAAQLADDFRHGSFTVVATAMIDGQLADKLVPTGKGSMGWTWISRATSLPLSVEFNGETVTYQWFGSIDPSTIWPAVPAGFQQVELTPELLYHS